MVKAPLIALPSDEAHLWILEDEPERIGAELLAIYDGWMLPEERARRDRYYFEKNKREYLLTRALVRSTLSRYVPVAPGEWTFTKNEYGRPAIAGPSGAWLRFNLSNTAGMVVCLVAREREVGVDVENMERSGETIGVADRFFAPTEVAELRSLPASAQRRRFFDYWTLKEAYIKARGMGLAIPLEQFAFSLGGQGREITISFDPRLDDVPSTWQFLQHRASARHMVSLAIRKGRDPDLRVIARRTIPLLPAAEREVPL